MTVTKILITGATGYIGGSVLSTLLKSTDSNIKNAEYSALVRKQEHADLLAKHGVKGILFSGLEDVDAVRKAASEHDVVINTASAFQPGAAGAIIDGLAERKKQTGREAYLIHTSGTSSIGDRPITKTFTETRILSDEDDIYAYERKREDQEAYAQRTTDLIVFENGDEAAIKYYILMSPTIYGIGSGLFNRTSIQIDGIMRAARRDGYTSVIGSGAAEWDHVHIEDLVALYELVLSRALAGADDNNLPSNRRGLYFNETGHHTWREISDRVAAEGAGLGHLKSDEVREVSLEDGSKAFGPPPFVAELGFSSRARSRADKARRIGWKPTKTRKDFEDSFAEEWRFIGKEE